ncbi:NADAR family protein [Dyadobacter subterraneus]|uniref:NADAR family protein n=1 Tax=Dyadobacter subterraneus TaxID=2773304 RepID=A0ABR9WCL3_9BACT|nr:NADAR family protein [Dyadobacter subterraneus]MBE9463215.1 NADAR family protein [Dyadobacter subterraneus]
MKYNLESVLESFDRGDRQKFIYFWGNQPDRSGLITSSCLSQWWAAPFVEDGVIYKTAEHWMMAQKAALFDNDDIFQKIILAKSPAEAKELGRQVRDFREDVWLEKRSEIVIKGSLLKFSQHKELDAFLSNTKDRILVEASPVDVVWGVGLAAVDEKIKNPNHWNGLNLLGFALMEVRDILEAK